MTLLPGNVNADDWALCNDTNFDPSRLWDHRLSKCLQYKAALFTKVESGVHWVSSAHTAALRIIVACCMVLTSFAITIFWWDWNQIPHIKFSNWIGFPRRFSDPLHTPRWPSATPQLWLSWSWRRKSQQSLTLFRIKAAGPAWQIMQPTHRRKQGPTKRTYFGRTTGSTCEYGSIHGATRADKDGRCC